MPNAELTEGRDRGEWPVGWKRLLCAITLV
jgi:hypothetical protein